MERLELVTPPAIEPVSVAEAKAHLRVEADFAADDDYVSDLIVAAREACEAELSQSLITTTWAQYLDGFPFGGGYFNRTVRAMGEGPAWLPSSGGGVIPLFRPPLIDVVKVEYVDMNGSAQEVDPALYYVSRGTPGRIQPVMGKVFPVAAPVVDAVKITFTAGYGPDPSDVPAAVRLAIKILVALYYEGRETPGAVPDGVRTLLASAAHGAYG